MEVSLLVKDDHNHNDSGSKYHETHAGQLPDYGGNSKEEKLLKTTKKK
jgi:hypothetical protein